MNAKDKLRVLLAHWIEHNKGHEAECTKWVAVSRKEGLDKVSATIEQAVMEMNKANVLLQQALELAGGELKKDGDDHHHHHHH